MKTIKEWLEGLEEPQKSQALKNVEELHKCPGGVLLVMRESLRDALLSAFVWDKSPQGHEYWLNIYEKLFGV